MKIFEFREWMIDSEGDNVPDNLLEELGWCWVDAYDGKQNNHPFGYGYWSTFDPKVVVKTKDQLGVRVTTKYGEQ